MQGRIQRKHIRGMFNVANIGPLDGMFEPMDQPSMTNQVMFSELRDGEWFVYQGVDYLKQNYREAMSEDGGLEMFEPDLWVSILD